MTGTDKISKRKKIGFIVTTIFHSIALIVFLSENSMLVMLNLEAEIKAIEALTCSIIIAIISLIITIVFKIISKSRLAWVSMNVIITLARCIIILDSGEFTFLVNIIYVLLLYVVSLAALYNWLKKQPEDPYNTDVVIRKSIHEQIYDEYGNFGD